MKSITIKMRLVVTLVILSALLIVVGGIGIWGMGQAKNGLQTVYEDRTVPLMDLGTIIDAANRIRTNAVVATNATDPAVVQKMIDDTAELDRTIEKLWSGYLATTLTPEEAELADSFGMQWKRYQASRDVTLKFAEEGDMASATQNAMKDAGPKFADAHKTLFSLIELQGRVAKAEYDSAVDIYQTVRMVAILSIILGVLIAALAGWLLIRAIMRPLNTAIGVADRIANGELDNTIVIDRNDEVGKMLAALKRMNEKLVSIVGEVRTASESVGGSAQEIASGNNELSVRTEEQASSLEETASSMEEMTSTVKQNADNARQANQLANGAREQAEKGGEVVGNAVSAMGEINTASKKIADIISVIDEIAFQTNLLALNAAVEAARAGEQGRGFAVVAGEVRNLAQRSATAAREIKDLIEDSVSKVQQGSDLVNASGQTLEEIVKSVKKVTDIVAEIASASQEQATGIDQVNKAVMQMDEMTQQNAALVEQAAAASQSMSEQADGLQQQISFFKLSAEEMDRRSAPRKPQSAGAGRKAAPQARKPAASSGAGRAAPAKSASESAPRKQEKVAAGDDEWEEF